MQGQALPEGVFGVGRRGLGAQAPPVWRIRRVGQNARALGPLSRRNQRLGQRLRRIERFGRRGEEGVAEGGELGRGEFERREFLPMGFEQRRMAERGRQNGDLARRLRRLAGEALLRRQGRLGDADPRPLRREEPAAPFAAGR